jgi:hypothetical protein
MPANTNSLLQPLAHKRVTAFKSYYTPYTFYSILDAPAPVSVNAGTADRIVNITDSMDKLSRAWNSCWKKLWPQAVKRLTGGTQTAERNTEHPCVSLQSSGRMIYRF